MKKRWSLGVGFERGVVNIAWCGFFAVMWYADGTRFGNGRRLMFEWMRD